ncbi:MAG: ferritin family protein, partial [bacterium]
LTISQSVVIPASAGIQDVLIYAIKSEQKAHELYTSLTVLYAEEDEKNLFRKLANEELTHKNDLEKVYDDNIYKEN